MKTIYLTLCLPTLLVAIFSLTGCGASSDSSGTPTSGGGTTSQSGSTAAMLPYKNALYVLDRYRLKVFDVSDAESATLVSESRLIGIETLFIYKDRLYIGGQLGVDIYNIEDPLVPVKESVYPHARGCDPIVLSDDVAYITLRSRNGCPGDANRLEMVDFTDPLNPIDIAELEMDFPYGVAQTEKYLAICQEGFGLSLIDAKVDRSGEIITAAPEEVANYTAIDCFDLIYNDNILLATALDGIHQFRMDDIFLEKISTIPVGVAAE